MWALFAGLLLYGSNRPKIGDNAAGTAFLVLIGIVWLVAGIIEVAGKLIGMVL